MSVLSLGCGVVRGEVYGDDCRDGDEVVGIGGGVHGDCDADWDTGDVGVGINANAEIFFCKYR